MLRLMLARGHQLVIKMLLGLSQGILIPGKNSVQNGASYILIDMLSSFDFILAKKWGGRKLNCVKVTNH
jgi:hypothetical protein